MKKVALTGAAGYVGQKLLARLEQHSSVEKIIAFDCRELPPGRHTAKLEFHRLDIRDPQLVLLLKDEKVDCFFHLAFVVDPIRNEDEMSSINREGMDNVLRAVAACGAQQLIAASSTSAFGAFPDNSVWLDEYTPLREHNGYAYAADKFAIENTLRSFSKEHHRIKVAVVRPCIIYGPGVNNYLSRFILNWPFLIQVGSARPPMQFVHEDDVATAFLRVFEQEASGCFHVVGEGVISTTEIAKLAGIRILSLPPWLAYPLVNLLYRLHIPGVEAPGAMLDFIRFRWTASDHLTRESLGFKPQHSSKEVIKGLLAGKKQGP